MNQPQTRRKIGRPLTSDEIDERSDHAPTKLAEPNKRQMYTTRWVEVKDANGKVVGTRREYVGVVAGPGQFLGSRDNAVYRVSGDGSLWRVEKPHLTKSEKKRAQRQAREAKKLEAHRRQKLEAAAKEMSQ